MPVAFLWINASETVLMRAETDHVMLVAVHLLNIDAGIDRTWEHSHDESQMYLCVILITTMNTNTYLLIKNKHTSYLKKGRRSTKLYANQQSTPSLTDICSPEFDPWFE